MSGNAIKIAPLIPIPQPMVTTQVMPINLGNLKFAATTANSLVYNPVSNPLSLVIRPNIPPLTIANGPNKPPPLYVKTPLQKSVGISSNHKSVTAPPAENQAEIVYQFINPEDLNLRYIKRGRKKSKTQDPPEVKVEAPAQPVKAPRTRSGRIVKTPKHIGKDFEKILSTHSAGFKTEKFTQVEEKVQPKKEFQVLENHCKKRTVSARYRCSICNKSYLSKRAAYLHLLKNPGHGPLPDENNNFEVWNYLVDVTQKRSSGQRGVKFCEELTNLLHNLQLLTGALFKTENTTKNNPNQRTAVQIDKILGNAMGLQPGKYYFDENELYKDVTVLKLITNSQFFAPKKAPPDAAVGSNLSANCAAEIVTDKNIDLVKNITSNIEPDVDKSAVSNMDLLSETGLNRGDIEIFGRTEVDGKNIDGLTRDIVNTNNNDVANLQETKFKRHLGDTSNKALPFPQGVPTKNYSTNGVTKNAFEIKTANTIEGDPVTKVLHQNCIEVDGDPIINGNFKTSSLNSATDKQISFSESLLVPTHFKAKRMPGIKTGGGDLKMPNASCVDRFDKAMDDQIMDGSYKKLDTSLSLHSDLLSENSLLALPHLRSSDDEIMLTNVEPGSNLLDNSTSSDEVMNVDQFVNERFKKITEPDTDLKFNTSLNLDLPSLDLFQFHTS